MPRSNDVRRKRMRKEGEEMQERKKILGLGRYPGGHRLVR